MKIKMMPLGILQANCYILWNEKNKDAIVFDCGGEADKVLSFLSEKQLVLKYIILTHGHMDHILGVNQLKRESSATIIAHHAEAELLKDPKKNLSDRFRNKEVSLVADQWIEQDGTLELCNYNFCFIHTPGHTPGGMCIIVDKIMFTGDTLFKGSIGRTDLYGGSMSTLQKSLDKLKNFSKQTIIYSGHGEKTTLGEELISNPFFR